MHILTDHTTFDDHACTGIIYIEFTFINIAAWISYMLRNSGLHGYRDNVCVLEQVRDNMFCKIEGIWVSACYTNIPRECMNAWCPYTFAWLFCM